MIQRCVGSRLISMVSCTPVKEPVRNFRVTVHGSAVPEDGGGNYRPAGRRQRHKRASV